MAISVNSNLVIDGLVLYIDPNNRNFKYLGNTQFKNLAKDPLTTFDILTATTPLLSSSGLSNYLKFVDGRALITDSPTLSANLNDYAIQLWFKDNTVSSNSDLTLKPIIVGGVNTITLNSSAIQIANLDTDIPAYNFDGTYFYIGNFNGKFRFAKPSTIWPNLVTTNYVYWLSSDNSWNIGDPLLVIPGLSSTFDFPKFKSFSDVEFPWEASNWVALLSSFHFYISPQSPAYRFSDKIHNERGLENGYKNFYYTDGSVYNTSRIYFDGSLWWMKINNTDVLSATQRENVSYASPDVFRDLTNYLAIVSSSNPYDNFLNSIYFPVKDKKGKGGRYNFYSSNQWNGSSTPLDSLKRFVYDELPAESEVSFSTGFEFLSSATGIYANFKNKNYNSTIKPNVIDHDQNDNKWKISLRNSFGLYEIYHSEQINNPTTPGQATTWTSIVSAICAYGGFPPNITDSVYISPSGSLFLDRPIYESINFPSYEELANPTLPLMAGFIYEPSLLVSGVNAWHYYILNTTNSVIAFSSIENVQNPWEVTQWDKAQSTSFFGFEAEMPIIKPVELPIPIVSDNTTLTGWLFYELSINDRPFPSYYDLSNENYPFLIDNNYREYTPYYFNTIQTNISVRRQVNPRIDRIYNANHLVINDNFSIIPSTSFDITTGDNFFFIDKEKRFGFVGSNGLPITTLNLTTSGGWNLLTFNVSGGRRIELYKNLLYETILSPIANNFTASLSTFSFGFKNFDIGQLLFYNKTLEHNEIAQNYKAFKTRYEGFNNTSSLHLNALRPLLCYTCTSKLSSPLFDEYPPRTIFENVDELLLQRRDDSNKPVVENSFYRKKARACSRSVIIDFRIINNVNTIVNYRLDNKQTENNFDILDFIIENNLFPHEDGTYIYGYSFYGWRSNLTDNGGISDYVGSSDNFDLYRRKL